MGGHNNVRPALAMAICVKATCLSRASILHRLHESSAESMPSQVGRCGNGGNGGARGGRYGSTLGDI